MMPRAILLLSTMCTMLGPVLAGQQANVSSYAIPEAPALTFLDATPAEITRPITPPSLATTLASGIGTGGTVQQGFAVAITPWTLIPGMRIPLKKYQESAASFLLANTELSLGTVQTPGDAGSTDLSVGVRLTLWDNSDPMRDRRFTAGVHQRLQRECVPGDFSEAAAAKLKECGARVNREAREQWRDSGMWNRSSFAVAAALGTRMDESRLDTHRWLGWSAWAVGALPLTKSGQILAQLRFDDRRPTTASSMIKTLRFGARGFVGSATVNLFAELVGSSQLDGPAESDGTHAEWSAGIEFRAAEQLWLSTGIGSARAADSDHAIILAGLRWNVLDAPRFGL